MNRLWAPWRDSYITNLTTKKLTCAFCAMLAVNDNGKKQLIFIRRSHAFAVLNLYPYSNGHCMVVPNRHVGDISKLSQQEYVQLMELLRETKDLLQTVLKPQGFNVGINLGRIAGAGIPGHLHIHIVPRWKGDHNFMPVTAATKVISQSLSVTYKKLNDAYKKDIEDLESKTLAVYAMKSRDAGARQHEEPKHEWRTCYQRDRDRVVHSEAFRKLEYKTQVFVIFEGDYYRTRLTHTIEVAQLARTLGRNLRLNEDLIEAIALAHDLGHPPFGHAGEDALNNLVHEAKIQFNHNFRSYEIVTKLEKKYPHFDGLNLTRDVLLGILKHQTVFDIPGADIPKEYRDEGPTLEAQIVDIADSLAYLNHDIDDGLTSGCILEEDLMDSVLWQKAVGKIGGHGEGQSHDMFRYQVVKELIDMQVKDLLKATYERLVASKFKSAQDVKKHKGYIVGFSKSMHKEREYLQVLLNEKLYHHWRVERMTAKARRIIRDLFDVYLRNPKQLPYSVYARDKKFSTAQKYGIICNYIASMTDRFALDEHKRLFDPYQKV